MLVVSTLNAQRLTRLMEPLRMRAATPITFPRRTTRPVRVGSSDTAVTIGRNYPIVVQSMITEETHNVPAAVKQIIAMHQAGAEIVRVTTPNLAEARCLEEIKLRLRREYRDVQRRECSAVAIVTVSGPQQNRVGRRCTESGSQRDVGHVVSEFSRLA